VCGSFWGIEFFFKMAAVAMVTKVQNGHQIQKSSDLGTIWFPSRDVDVVPIKFHQFLFGE
jgi:hypothetical protein